VAPAAPAIAVRGVSKEFRSWRGPLRALDAVDLEVAPGEVFGLLGANGAGKTTLMKVLLGLTSPSAGAVEVRGLDPRRPAARVRVGYLPEGHRFPDYLSGIATLRLFGRLAGLDEATLDRRSPELLELVGLADRGGDRVGRYSKGMTQRLGLAAALLDRPEVLFLDEPTDGVDPVGRRHIRDILRATRAEGTTVFINSHLLSEVERTCDRVAILDRGRVVRTGGVDDLTRPGRRYRVGLAGGSAPPPDALAGPGVVVATRDGHLDVEAEDLAALNALIDRLRAGSVVITEVTPQRSALEDVFIEIVTTPENGDREPGTGNRTPEPGTQTPGGLGAA
jgi:ABC-2 type transport system ATP-binding protein